MHKMKLHFMHLKKLFLLILTSRIEIEQTLFYLPSQLIFRLPSTQVTNKSKKIYFLYFHGERRHYFDILTSGNYHIQTPHISAPSVINVEGLKRCRLESRPRLQSTDKYSVRRSVLAQFILIIYVFLWDCMYCSQGVVPVVFSLWCLRECCQGQKLPARIVVASEKGLGSSAHKSNEEIYPTLGKDRTFDDFLTKIKGYTKYESALNDTNAMRVWSAKPRYAMCSHMPVMYCTIICFLKVLNETNYRTIQD